MICEIVVISLFSFIRDSYSLRSIGDKVNTSIFSFNSCNTGELVAITARHVHPVYGEARFTSIAIFAEPGRLCDNVEGNTEVFRIRSIF